MLHLLLFIFFYFLFFFRFLLQSRLVVYTTWLGVCAKADVCGNIWAWVLWVRCCSVRRLVGITQPSISVLQCSQHTKLLLCGTEELFFFFTPRALLFCGSLTLSEMVPNPTLYRGLKANLQLFRLCRVWQRFITTRSRVALALTSKRPAGMHWKLWHVLMFPQTLFKMQCES